MANKIEVTGSDIYNTFKNRLGIDLGRMGVEDFDSWCETDDKDMKQFLAWLCTLDQQNVLSPAERKEYKKLKEKGTYLEGRDLESAVAAVNAKAPGVFDLPKNQFDVDFLKDEKEMLVKQKKSQLESLERIKSLNDHLRKIDQKKEDAVLKAEYEEKLAVEAYNKKTRELEDLHERLYNQMMKSQEVMLDFDSVNISSLSFDKFTRFHQEVNEHVESLLGKLWPVMDASVDALDTFAKLDKLYKRIQKSALRKKDNEVKIEKLRAQLDKMKTLHSKLSPEEIKSLKSTSKETLEKKKVEIDEMLSRLNDFISTAIMSENEKYKLDILKAKINSYSYKLSKLEKYEENLDKIISQYVVLDTMVSLEKEEIVESIGAISKVDAYISKLDSISNRMSVMVDTISSYNEYLEAPIERKVPLVKHVGNIIRGENGAECDICNLLVEVRELKIIHQNLLNDFLSSSEEGVKIYSQKRQSELKITENFLTSGSTKSALVISNRVQTVIDEAEAKTSVFHASLLSYQDDYIKNKARFENKPVNMYRSLWSLFNTDQSKFMDTFDNIKGGTWKECTEN